MTKLLAAASAAISLLFLFLTLQSAHAQASAPASTHAPRPAATAPALPEGATVQRDIPYITNAPPSQRLDLYLPKDTTKSLPLVIWVFGGGWQAGDKSDHWQPALPLLTKGFAVACINYRLSKEAPWPAQIQDCKAAVRFLRANAQKFHLDPDRFGAWGNSAGGHLVALLGTSGSSKDFDVGENLTTSSQVQAVCDWYGPTDLYALTLDILHAPPKKLTAARLPLEHLFNLKLAENDAVKNKMASANPIKYLDKNAPPFLIMHGKSDNIVPISQSQILADALKAAHIDVAFQQLEGGHGTGDFNQPPALESVEAFFQKYLRQ